MGTLTFSGLGPVNMFTLDLTELLLSEALSFSSTEIVFGTEPVETHQVATIAGTGFDLDDVDPDLFEGGTINSVRIDDSGALLFLLSDLSMPATVLNDDFDTAGLLALFLGGGDMVIGTPFGDGLMGLGGNDSINGGDGADTLDGGAGDDSVLGGLGDDTMIGAAGDDTLKGEDGNDNLFGGFGDDRAEGGLGADLIRTGPGSDTLLGGEGNDTLGASNRADLLRGEGGDDFMLGSNGNDRLFGGDGADTMLGGNGRDTLSGDAGADRLVGGNQIDWASYDAAGAAVAASLTTGTGSAGEALGDVLIDIENLEGSAFNDTLTGSSGTNRLDGGAGGDVLSGAGGADILAGEGGADTATGGAGNDAFWYRTGEGADTITDFTAGAATDDVIRLFGFGAAVNTFAEVIALASQVGADTVIDFGGGNSITLEGVAVGSLHADDFLFG